MKKIVFIDVDGTLTMQNGVVPQSAFEGIQKMRQKGIEVYLCTGRSMSEITSDIQDIGFDGYIAAGGGYIEKKGEVIYHRLMPQKSVEEMMRYFDTHQVGYYLESNVGLFPNEFCIPNIKRSVDRLVETSPHLFVDINKPYPNWFIDILKKSENKKVELDKINKLSFVSLDHPFEETFKQFSNQFEIYQSTVFEFGKESGEIGLKNIDKQFAIEMLLNTYC